MQFKAKVKADPANELRGVYLCTVTPAGIEMSKKKRTAVVLRGGLMGTYKGGNQVVVRLGGREVTLAVSKFGADQARLAMMLAEYVCGKRATIDNADVKLETYLTALAVLPFGIMILTRGGAIWGGLGGAVAFGCLALAQVETLSVAWRLALILVIN